MDCETLLPCCTIAVPNAWGPNGCVILAGLCLATNMLTCPFLFPHCHEPGFDDSRWSRAWGILNPNVAPWYDVVILTKLPWAGAVDGLGLELGEALGDVLGLGLELGLGEGDELGEILEDGDDVVFVTPEDVFLECEEGFKAPVAAVFSEWLPRTSANATPAAVPAMTKGHRGMRFLATGFLCEDVAGPLIMSFKSYPQ